MPEKKRIEKRSFSSAIKRAEGDEERKIVGYAAIFESVTELWNGYYEKIKAGAFKRTLDNGADVRALFNHDPNLILGRTTAGTLEVKEDEKGLNYEVDVPETTYGADLLVSVKRGDVNQSSFAFITIKEEFEKLENGDVIRTIIEASLHDVSPVTNPAYPDTEAEAKVAFRNAPEGLGIAEEKKTKIEEGADGKEAKANPDPMIHLANAERRQRLLEIKARL